MDTKIKQRKLRLRANADARKITSPLVAPLHPIIQIVLIALVDLSRLLHRSCFGHAVCVR
jgi:hypothetical protein